jgi:ADP-heptose:LPS heptosyltransferase
LGFIIAGGGEILMNCFFIFAILTRQIIHKVLLKENVRQIVVFAPNKLFFGANILQIPFFQHLRSGYPYARITIWSPEKASEMMLNLNLADELLIYHGWGDYFRIFRHLLKLKPDIIFNLRWFSEGINLLTGLSPAKLRVGFHTSSPFRFLLNGSVARNDQTYMGLFYLDLLKPAGIDSLFFFEGIKKLDIDSKLSIPERDPIICLMPGGGEGEHKRWGIHNFCNLGKLILKRFPQAFLVFVLGPNENDYVGIISDHFMESEHMILMKGSLADIVKISKQSKVTVANDCGPSHLAQMTGGNYIGVWGWSNQHPLQRIINWTYPKPNSIHIVAKNGMDITQLKAEEVFRVARGFLMED